MIGKDNKLINTLFAKLKPFKGILWFLFLFLLFDVVWKIFVHQGETERILLLMGKDITSYTTGICLFTAQAVHWTVQNIFGYDDFKINGIQIYFDGGLPIDIIWGCTGIKQLMMFAFIMIFYFGSWQKKLWFIPLSLFIIFVINILRLAIIAIIVKDPFPEWFIPFNEWYNSRTWLNSRATHQQFYEDWFNIFHKDVFVWVYYDGVMFLLWLIWEEKVNKPYQRLRNKLTESKDKETAQ